MESLMGDRKRHMLVVSLGEREKGRALRELLLRKAHAEHLPFATWARRVLLEEAERILKGKVD
jgi:hypothetical protein